MRTPHAMSDTGVHDSERLSASAGDAQFGAYKLPHSRESIRSLGAAMFSPRFPRLGSVLNWPIWRLSLVGRPGPVDLEPYPGFRLRLYPRENHADTKCYARPMLVDLPEEAAIVRAARATTDGRFYVVDVGANTGTYSVLAASIARRVGKVARLVCIEANPTTQERLATNLLFSGLTAQSNLLPFAVSDRQRTVTLHEPIWNLGSVAVIDHAGKRPLAGSRQRIVEARPLTALVADAGLPRIDFLKIDIEGHETQALGPFFRDATRGLYPRMILAETKHDKGFALSNMLIGAGYVPTVHGRSDTVFELRSSLAEPGQNEKRREGGAEVDEGRTSLPGERSGAGQSSESKLALIEGHSNDAGPTGMGLNAREYR